MKEKRHNTSAFLTTSTYQNILATALAIKKESKTILISQRSFEDQTFIKVLLELQNNPFDYYICLPKIGRQCTLKNYVYDSYSAYRMYILCLSRNINEVYTTHSSPAGQALLENISGDRIYLEDGTATYCAMDTLEEQSQIKRYLSKAVYGPWWKGRYPQGAHPQFNKIAATYPKHIHDNRSGLTTEKIFSDKLYPVLYNWAKKYFKSINILNNIKNIETLFILPHSESLEKMDLDRRDIVSMIKTTTTQNKTVGVKYHPRDKCVNLSKLSKVVEVPQSVPAELLYNGKFELSEVIGGISTALMTAKWLLPHIKVSTYLPMRKIESENIVNIFKNIGVESVNFN